MGIRQGVNFIKVIRAALMCADRKSAKDTVKFSVFFVLLGSAPIKAARRTLMKSTQGSIKPVSFLKQCL